MAFKAAAADDARAVRIVACLENAAGHGLKDAQAVEVVADDALLVAIHLVNLGLAVRTADEQLILLRMPRHAHEPALERPRRDARDVVDEPLGRNLGQFHRHVAANGDEVRAVRRERGVQHPVVMRPLEEDLLACPGIDGPDGVVGAAEGDLAAVGRPARAVNGVVGDGDGELQGLFGDVPDLDFAEPARVAAGHGERLTVGRKGNRLDAFRQADQAAEQA